MEQQLYDVYVGSYTSEHEDGIHVLKFDEKTGGLSYQSSVSNVANPSFLTMNPTGNHVYVVSETDDGQVVSFKRTASGTLEELNRQSTGGSAPCYVSLDPMERWLYIANYNGGSVNVYPVLESGEIGPSAHFLQFTGHGTNLARQEGPHAHSIQTNPYTNEQVVADLGTDTVHIFRTDQRNGRLLPAAKLHVQPGSGPRHLDFHPTLSILYVVNELTSTVGIYQQLGSEAAYQCIQTVSSLPSDFTGENTAADIHISPNGQFLYATNRGHDSLVTWRIQSDGRLAYVAHTHTGGRTPRNFAISPSGGWILVANQDSDSIQVMQLADSGVPKLFGVQFDARKPVCIQFLSLARSVRQQASR